jgi:hypothetical protein
MMATLWDALDELEEAEVAVVVEDDPAELLLSEVEAYNTPMHEKLAEKA